MHSKMHSSQTDFIFDKTQVTPLVRVGRLNQGPQELIEFRPASSPATENLHALGVLER
jgi:hypothetical protein